MAEISKISAVAIANVAKVDAILKASIANINDLTIPSDFTGLLDTYSGAVSAFSVRRLYSLYTGACMRIREDSGDTETDIGFDANGDLDTAAIASHCGSANGYVVTWYGQEASGGTGSGNDIAEGTVTLQALIYDGSAVTTANGIAALTLDSDRVGSATTSSFNLNDFGLYTVNQASATPNTYQGSVALGVSNNQQAALNYRTSQQVYLATTSGTVSTNTTYNLSSMYADNTASEVKGYFNTTEITSTTPSSQSVSEVQVGHIRNITSTFFRGTIQEVVTFGSSTKSDHGGIQGNVNAHFQIGNFGTPTSGLLYDYSGAAAAYSVRQLANTALLAMRIREDGTDTETNIGFDSNGDLDTAAIASHCGTNNGYVVTWYDQAGSAYDLTQTTSGNQPKIYNGTSVITSNGQPILDRDTNGIMTFPMNTQGYKMFAVFETPGNAIMVGQGNNYFLVSSSGSSTSPIYSSAFTVNAYRHNGSSATLPSTWGDAFTEYSSQNLSYWDVDMPAGTIQLGFTTGANFGMYSMQELIMYPDTVTLNETGIETNINNYFSIY